MVNKYKDKLMNGVYNAYVKIDPKIVTRGSGVDSAFLNGYNGLNCRYIKTSLTYAAFQAGKQARKNNKITNP